jgi:hypothetical protein
MDELIGALGGHRRHVLLFLLILFFCGNWFIVIIIEMYINSVTVN